MPPVLASKLIHYNYDSWIFFPLINADAFSLLAKRLTDVLIFVNYSLIINDMEPLLANPEFLKSVIETMSDGLMVIDKESTILFFNRAAEEIKGYRREDIVGKQCSMLDNNTCSYKKQVGGLLKNAHYLRAAPCPGTHCHLRGRDGREHPSPEKCGAVEKQPGRGHRRRRGDDQRDLARHERP